MVNEINAYSENKKHIELQLEKFTIPSLDQSK